MNLGKKNKLVIIKFGNPVVEIEYSYSKKQWQQWSKEMTA